MGSVQGIVQQYLRQKQVLATGVDKRYGAARGGAKQKARW
jgi:hypothetical protein